MVPAEWMIYVKVNIYLKSSVSPPMMTRDDDVSAIAQCKLTESKTFKLQLEPQFKSHDLYRNHTLNFGNP